MFDELSDKLGNVFAKLRGRGVLTDADIKEGLREVRRVLLEADVNFALTREFLERVEQKAVGVLQIKTIQPAQQLVKIVYDELTAMLGERREGLKMSTLPPTVIMMVGLQGSGKTTTAGKLARKLMLENKSTRLVAADVYRPAAMEQLRVLGEQIDVPVHVEPESQDPVGIAQRAVAQARQLNRNVVIVDTAGRLAIDEVLMKEVADIRNAVQPQEILFVVDSMTGQDAVNTAKAFNDRLDFTGVVLTKLDGDTRGGAALSVQYTVQKPIKFVSRGEKMDTLDVFHPDRMAQRILGMGDITSLVEKAQAQFDEAEAKKLESKIRKNQFDFADFKMQIEQIKKMGNMKDLLGMIPGVGGKIKDLDISDDAFKGIEALINSMTPTERANPDLIDANRKKRIARGAGKDIQELNNFLKQFEQMRAMMKNMNKLGRFGPSQPGMR